MSIENIDSAEIFPRPNRNELSPEDADTLDRFDQEDTRSKGAYSARFENGVLNLADKYRTEIRSLLAMEQETVLGLKSTIETIAATGSRPPRTLSGYINQIATAVKKHSVSNFSPESYSTLVHGASKETNVSFRSILTTWYRLGYPGVNSATLDIVEALKLPAKRGRNRVISDDPTEGWYTSQEYEGLVATYWNDLESGEANLRNTSALLLNAQFGRRGIQLANLKVGDFESEGQREGLSGRRVAFPAAKDRTAVEWFRGSKFEVHPLGEDLWKLCMLQIDSTIAHHESFFERSLSPAERDLLPFFEKDVRSLKPSKYIDLVAAQAQPAMTANLHLSSSAISSTLARNGYGSVVMSQRTGTPVREFAYRMRFTRARQLARLGVPRNILHYWLGHENELSLEHYYDDPAENARLLDIDMRPILAPLAQAFLGTLRDNESEAVRGDDPSSRIELDGRHNVGTCGEHGFCSASVPIPCYRCSKFQPWVHAPHEEVLIRLLERQEEENNIHLPSRARRLLAPLQLSKDIEAVKLVILSCDARKEKLKSSKIDTQSDETERSSNASELSSQIKDKNDD
jgi:integrase